MLLVEQPEFTLRLPDGWTQLPAEAEQLSFQSSEAHLLISVLRQDVPPEKLDALAAKLAEIRVAAEQESVPGVRHAPPSVKRKAEDHAEVMYAGAGQSIAFCFWGVVTTQKVFSFWLSADTASVAQKVFAQLVPCVSLMVP
ncbi:MAG: hypothetical protein U0228_36090 [Myxococcaceae bacterium]